MTNQHLTEHEHDKHVELHELGNAYVCRGNRFVVSLLVGYAGCDDDDVTTPNEAAAYALDLTRDDGCADTYWYVYDRETGTLSEFEQADIEPITRWP